MGEKDIEQKCLRLIDENGAEALKSDGFENVALETVKKIISRDTLEIKELDVWLACLRWAEKECQRQDKQVSISVPLLFTSRVSGRGNRIAAVFPSVCVCQHSHGRTVRPMTLIFGMGVDLDLS